ncbi:MAG: lysophospholipid acyltransferase family protein [Reichenbachiella sp.]|uniref:lysophospholipid acyltransferase family protein n=1 Tax=Reichenbachiella sp. TaxID=2184521 RepID=UPI00329A2C72
MNSNNQSPNTFNLFLLRIYLIYAGFMFTITFLLGTPVVLLALILKYDKLALVVNHYWAYVFFFLVGIRLEVTKQSKVEKKSTYIFCANHFSFLDIAIMPVMPVPFKFVGKVSIAKVPLMGAIFKRFHITVDRAKLRDRYATYKKGIEALKSNCSLTIFPEGGIRSANPPQMESFKEGPFRMAIETGVSLVPVTLADNWHIFPDDGQFFFRRKKCRIVIHEPIDPSKYTMETLKEFQEDVKKIIQQELSRLNS